MNTTFKPKNQARKTARSTRRSTPSRPAWDAATHSLMLGGRLVKHFQKEAPNQEAILHAFEKTSWPTCLEFSLPGTRAQAAKDCLRNTLRNLNRSVTPYLRFRHEGNGSRVRWELLPH